MSQDNKDRVGARRTGKFWMPIIILLGVSLGLILDLAAGSGGGGPAPPFGPPSSGFNLTGAYHIILSTLGIVLLISLIAVYARTYRQTRGRFSLGLLVIFSSLLFQEIFSSPLLSHLLEHTPFAVGFAGPIADTFRIIAYAIFLYISLE